LPSKSAATQSKSPATLSKSAGTPSKARFRPPNPKKVGIFPHREHLTLSKTDLTNPLFKS